MLSVQEEKTMLAMGRQLKAARIQKGDTQKEFGARIGVSRNIVGKMEQGDSSVALKRWIKAASILGTLEAFSHCFAIQEDPFDVFDREQAQLKKIRKRVRK